MKRAKQMDLMVQSFNEFLELNNITSTNDTSFVVFTHCLLQSGCYRGYGYKTYTNIGGQPIAITCNESNADFLFIY